MPLFYGIATAKNSNRKAHPSTAKGGQELCKKWTMPHFGVKSNGAVTSIWLKIVLEEDGAACVAARPVRE
jgi:hypothetical protein